LADSVAKVGRVDWRRNFRFAGDSFLNLPSDAKAADESMLRASPPKILLQQYLAHSCRIGLSQLRSGLDRFPDIAIRVADFAFVP
jgi:hypothetical protein